MFNNINIWSLILLVFAAIVGYGAKKIINMFDIQDEKKRERITIIFKSSALLFAIAALVVAMYA